MATGDAIETGTSEHPPLRSEICEPVGPGSRHDAADNIPSTAADQALTAGGQDGEPEQHAALETEEGSSLCIICWDGAREAVLLECGHSGLCVACAQRISRSAPALRVCPICRQGFAAIVRIVHEEHGAVRLRSPPRRLTLPRRRWAAPAPSLATHRAVTDDARRRH